MKTVRIYFTGRASNNNLELCLYKRKELTGLRPDFLYLSSRFNINPEQYLVFNIFVKSNQRIGLHMAILDVNSIKKINLISWLVVFVT